MQKEAFQLLSQYNRWMNERLYAASAGLDEDELLRDRGAFFGSVLGTLNHIMIGDILWLKRFAMSPQGFPSLANVSALPNPPSLDAMLHSSLKPLHAARRRLDTEIIEFCDELTAERLAETVRYKNFAGEDYADPLGVLLQHLFNHQTHHRGQVTTLLSQSGIDVGATDLMVCVRELEASPRSREERG